jgi:hypothetical protein
VINSMIPFWLNCALLADDLGRGQNDRARLLMKEFDSTRRPSPLLGSSPAPASLNNGRTNSTGPSICSWRPTIITS